MKFNRKQTALGVSLVFHGALLAVLFFWCLPGPRAPTAPVAERSESNQSSVRESPREAEALERLAQQQPDVKAKEIENSIESQIEQAKTLSDERKLSELEKNLKRLDSIASERSVDQVTVTVAKSLGLDVDQYAPRAAPIDGTFDTNSAQISDVQRSKDDQGNWRYETVMVDSQGREMRVLLGSDEGARLYETFELMKRYPMAQGVYQGVVMPLMQKMLEGESVQRGDQPTVILPAEGSETTP